MASIVSSVLVESVPHGSTKRNLYRYTLDNGEVHTRRGWISSGADNDTDMNARGTHLLVELANAEIDLLLSQ